MIKILDVAVPSVEIDAGAILNDENSRCFVTIVDTAFMFFPAISSNSMFFVVIVDACIVELTVIVLVVIVEVLIVELVIESPDIDTNVICPVALIVDAFIVELTVSVFIVIESPVIVVNVISVASKLVVLIVDAFIVLNDALSTISVPVLIKFVLIVFELIVVAVTEFK